MPREKWGNVSIEGVVDDGVLLVSNLDSDVQTLTFAPDAVLEVADVSGKNLLAADPNNGNTALTLKPFELAFVKVD